MSILQILLNDLEFVRGSFNWLDVRLKLEVVRVDLIDILGDLALVEHLREYLNVLKRLQHFQFLFHFQFCIQYIQTHMLEAEIMWNIRVEVVRVFYQNVAALLSLDLIHECPQGLVALGDA
jgi:hypothetical protein